VAAEKDPGMMYYKQNGSNDIIEEMPALLLSKFVERCVVQCK
jgi:hypothetical protein